MGNHIHANIFFMTTVIQQLNYNSCIILLDFIRLYMYVVQVCMCVPSRIIYMHMVIVIVILCKVVVGLMEKF